MRPTRQLWLNAAVVAVFGCVGFALVSTTSAAQWFTASMGFPGVAYGGRSMTNAAYSAQEVQEHTQTLADGTHITNKPHIVQMYRDSEGRTRTERHMLGGPNSGNDGPVIIQIDDPVAGFQYTLDTQNHVAHRVKLTEFPRPAANMNVRSGTLGATLPPPSSSAPPPSGSANLMTQTTTATAGTAAGQPLRPATKRESLGTQEMEGVTVEGTRFTTTIPAGMYGNDQPMTTVSEQWVYTPLHLTVMRKMTDPRTGENTFRLDNLVVGEPDPGLFVPPPDYTVVDESGPFQIRYTR